MNCLSEFAVTVTKYFNHQNYSAKTNSRPKLSPRRGNLDNFLNFIPSRFTTTNNQPRINEMPQPKSRGHSEMLNDYTDII